MSYEFEPYICDLRAVVKAGPCQSCEDIAKIMKLSIWSVFQLLKMRMVSNLGR